MNRVLLGCKESKPGGFVPPKRPRRKPELFSVPVTRAEGVRLARMEKELTLYDELVGQSIWSNDPNMTVRWQDKGQPRARSRRSKKAAVWHPRACESEGSSSSSSKASARYVKHPVHRLPSITEKPVEEEEQDDGQWEVILLDSPTELTGEPLRLPTPNGSPGDTAPPSPPEDLPTADPLQLSLASSSTLVASSYTAPKPHIPWTILQPVDFKVWKVNDYNPVWHYTMPVPEAFAESVNKAIPGVVVDRQRRLDFGRGRVPSAPPANARPAEKPKLKKRKEAVDLRAYYRGTAPDKGGSSPIDADELERSQMREEARRWFGLSI